MTTDVCYKRARFPEASLAVRHGCFGILAAAILAASWSGLANLVRFSFGHDQYSFIVLVPAVSIILIAHNRDVVFSGCRWSPWIGLSLISAGILARVAIGLSYGLDSIAALYAAALSLVLLILGAFVLCYGTGAARASLFPLLFLFLTLPIPPMALNAASQFLQKASADLTYYMMTLAGVPVLRRDFIFLLPGANIEIVRECSGINSTVGLLILSLIAGHLYLHAAWRKAALALAVIPVSIFKNALRINALYWLGVHVDRAFLTGPPHRYGGLAFSLVAIAILAPLLWLFRKSENERELKSVGISVSIGIADRIAAHPRRPSE